MFRLRRLLVELLLLTALEPRTHHHHHHQQQCVDTKSQIEEHSRDKHLFRGQQKNGRLIGIVKIIPSSPKKENDNKTVTFPSNSPPSGKGKTKIDPSRRAALAQKWLSIEWTQPRVEWRGEDNHLCWERRRRRKGEKRVIDETETDLVIL